MTRIFLDSSAWVEYLGGTPKGLQIRSWVEKPEVTIFITGLVVSEVISYCLRQGKSAELAQEILRNLTTLLPYDYILGEKTARLLVLFRKTRQKFCLADAHILAAARSCGSKVITCDNDFTGIENVMMIR
jgi:predicted nucleic acid-binding protein